MRQQISLHRYCLNIYSSALLKIAFRLFTLENILRISLFHSLFCLHFLWSFYAVFNNKCACYLTSGLSLIVVKITVPAFLRQQRLFGRS